MSFSGINSAGALLSTVVQVPGTDPTNVGPGFPDRWTFEGVAGQSWMAWTCRIFDPAALPAPLALGGSS